LLCTMTDECVLPEPSFGRGVMRGSTKIPLKMPEEIRVSKARSIRVSSGRGFSKVPLDDNSKGDDECVHTSGVTRKATSPGFTRFIPSMKDSLPAAAVTSPVSQPSTEPESLREIRDQMKAIQMQLEGMQAMVKETASMSVRGNLGNWRAVAATNPAISLF